MARDARELILPFGNSAFRLFERGGIFPLPGIILPLFRAHVDALFDNYNPLERLFRFRPEE